MWDALCLNVRIATMAQDAAGFGLIDSGAVAIRGQDIAWVGAVNDLPHAAHRRARTVWDMDGRLLTPGLIDPHTHVVHAGSRWEEFVWRHDSNNAPMPVGRTGLQWTVTQTRAASRERLLEESLARARALIAEGVTSLESKTGYGLDLDTEVRMAGISRDLGRILPLTIISTFLGAHAVGPEYAGRPDDYIDFLCRSVLPRLVDRGLVDAVDVFCDERGFDHGQVRKLFTLARSHGLALFMHADQYAAYGAGKLGAALGASAIAHLEHAEPATAEAMARAGSVAVLLPSVSWAQDSQSRPPIVQLRRWGVPIALATNANPGSSPCTSPSSVMNLACQLFDLSPLEALAGFTRNAARAVGLHARCGSLAVGKQADLAVWNVVHPAELSSHIGGGLCHAVVKKGSLVPVNQLDLRHWQADANA